MGKVILKHPAEHILGLALLPFCNGTAVNLFKHKRAQILQRLFHIRGQADRTGLPGNPDNVRYQGIDPGGMVLAQDVRDF